MILCLRVMQVDRAVCAPGAYGFLICFKGRTVR